MFRPLFRAIITSQDELFEEIIQFNLLKFIYSFIYSKTTTCFGPYSEPSLGQKMNYLRKLYSLIY